jgi:hypothetical protein
MVHGKKEKKERKKENNNNNKMKRSKNIKSPNFEQTFIFGYIIIYNKLLMRPSTCISDKHQNLSLVSGME